MGNAVSAPEAGAAPSPSGQLPSALVIVGPSGVGKGTLIDKLKEGSDLFGFSCSHTTRQPRQGEQDGVHYHFTSKEAFEREIAEGKFLEYAYVHSNIYGTSIKAVQDVAAAGKCCILDIDVQGARQVRASGLRAIFVFVAPPSVEELERRLRGRGTESEEQITTRLKNAREELSSVQEPGLYDIVLINNDLEGCFKDLVMVAARALAGEVGAPAFASSLSSPAPAHPQEPGSAAASLSGWLGSTPVADPGVSLGESGMERWRGKVAMVTGAGSSLGWELSLALAASGCKVVAVSRGKAALEALQSAALEVGVPPADFLPVVCDLNHEAEVVALPRIVARRWPGAGVDVLINSAAAGRRADGAGGLMGGATSAWVEAVGTNVLGTAMVTREVVQDMRSRGSWGHVVYLGCSGGTGGMHAVSKAAVREMAAALKREARAVGAPLRVSCIIPGEVTRSGSDLGPALRPADVAAAVGWCLAAPPHVDTSEVALSALPV